MKFKKYLVEVTILILFPVILSIVFYKLIPIQNVNPISIVSVTALINFIIWTLIIFQMIGSYNLLQRYSPKIVLEINLYFILSYIAAFKILIKALSLKGTPLPGSDIRGDLLKVANLAKLAEADYWSGESYPPIWPSLIGNAARLLDVHVLSLFKPAEFILLAISPLLILYIWRLIVESWMALLISINQVLIYGFEYKTFTLNLLIPTLLYTIISVKNDNSNKILKSFLLGLLLGLLSLTYSGYLYWLIPVLIGISILVFTPKHRDKKLKKHNFIYLGLVTALGPVIYSQLFEKILFFYIAVFGIVLLILFSRMYEKIETVIHFLCNIMILFGLIYIFLNIRAIDTWVEGGIEKNNPTTSSIVDFSGSNLILALVFLLGIYIIFIKHKDLIVLMFFVGVYISSAIFMYFIASQMQVTSRIDLWPRAREVQSYSSNLFLIILTLYLVHTIINDIRVKKSLEGRKQNFYIFVVLVLFFVGSYLVNSIGTSAYTSMPYHAFGSAWFANQGCSNPHEDPMLSKVFEIYPDIQVFLRENCSSVNWPVIPNKS
jgi:hypothetical protein